jgi:nucleotide-binding universal stress UspA family protein
MKVLLAYDGSLQAKNILREMVQKDRESRNRLIVLHVFNSGLFVGYDAVPGIEEMARRESSVSIAEAQQIILDAGARIYARIVEEDGVPEEEIVRYVETEGIDMLLCPKRFMSVMRHVKKYPCRETEAASALFTRQEGPMGIPVHRYS